MARLWKWEVGPQKTEEKIMRVLVISCNTGEGHNAAGRAVYENLTDRGIEAEFVNMMALMGDKVDRAVSGTYVKSTRIPFVFHTIYRIGGAVSRLLYNMHVKSPVYLANRKCCGKLGDYIEEKEFDVVVTPHLFCAETLTALKRSGRLRAKTMAICTDYTSIPFWEETELDYYVIPHEDLCEEFIKKGIPKEKLLPYGIPVMKAFRTRMSREKACTIINSRENIHLDTRKRTYLVMSGSMGFGKVELLTVNLIRYYGDRVNVVIICGNNEKLRRRLNFLFSGHKNVIICGFTKQVALYMDACDVLFTKPGGLSGTEAAVKNIPIVHTNPIPGCETKNAEFFSQRGMSCSCTKIKEQLQAARQLCRNESARNQMLESQRAYIFPGTCDRIVEKIMEISEVP